MYKSKKGEMIMRKLTSLVMVTAMSVMMLAGCGSSKATESAAPAETADTVATTEAVSTAAEEEASETEAVETTEYGPTLAAIKERGKLIVGTASGYPPYEFIDITSPNQDVIGIDMELAKAIADELGVELEVQDMTFSAVLTSLPAHKIDLAIAGINPTDERKKTLDFSDVYLKAEQSLIILKDNADKYKTLEDFAGEKISAQKATTQETLVQESMTESACISLDKVPDCILEVINGKAAAVCVESIVGQQYLITNDNLMFSEATFDLEKNSAIAIEKGNEDLVEIINKVIKENQDNGNFEKWVTEYSEKAAANAQ